MIEYFNEDCTATAILTRRKMFVISLVAFFVGLITMLLGLVALDVFTTSVGFLAFAGGYLALELEEV